MQDNNNPLNSLHNDINGIKEFHGDKKKYASVWTRNLMLLAKLANYNKETTLRALIFK